MTCEGCHQPIRSHQKYRYIDGWPVHDKPECIEMFLEDDGT